MLVVSICISLRELDLWHSFTFMLMITIGSSFVLHRLNRPDSNKLLGFGESLPILYGLDGQQS